MNRRELIGKLYARTGQRIGEDDPAMLLVELADLMLEERTNQAADRLAAETERFGTTSTQAVDDFVAVANEALGKFTAKTGEITRQLDGLKSIPTAHSPAVNPQPSKKNEPPAYLWWLIPVIFMAALALGISIGLLLK